MEPRVRPALLPPTALGAAIDRELPLDPALVARIATDPDLRTPMESTALCLHPQGDDARGTGARRRPCTCRAGRARQQEAPWSCASIYGPPHMVPDGRYTLPLVEEDGTLAVEEPRGASLGDGLLRRVIEARR